MILLIYQLKSLLKICIFKMQASLRLLIPKLRNKYEAYDNWIEDISDEFMWIRKSFKENVCLQNCITSRFKEFMSMVAL